MSEIQHYMDAVARLKAENSVLERERDAAQAVAESARERLYEEIEKRDAAIEDRGAAEARLEAATDALRDALPFVEAATEPDNTPTVRRHAEKVVAAARAVLVGGDAGLEDPAFDDSQGHGEGRLLPAELREDVGGDDALEECGCAYETVEDGSVQRRRYFHDPECAAAGLVDQRSGV